MKKMLLPVLLVFGASCFAQTQTRRCGTMEYYEAKMKSDPSVKQRMEANELQTQEWIKNHAAVKTAIGVAFPSIEGFTPTGNEALDRVNYANAKAAYLLKHPRANTATTNGNAITDKQLRENKRKLNQMITH